MLDGGLVPHRPYLIVGPSGTGKTKLVLQFLCEGVRRGERVLLVTVEEPPNEVRLNHRALAPDLDRVDVFDAIPDVMRYERVPFKDIASVRAITPFGQISPEIRRSPELASVEVTITALEQMLRSEVIRRRYSRIAIDSLTALQYFCMKGFDPIGGAQTFLRFLSDLRTTTVLTVEAPLEDLETTERALARGEIRLFRWELDGVTVRAIGVEKLRGSSHDVRLHPYRIGPHGIDVNLTVTISRDTRQIVELPPRIAPPHPVAAGPSAVPPVAPLSDEVRDLIALGVDVGPVRGSLEAAIAAARAGRTDDAVREIGRLASLTAALSASVAGGEASAPGTASPIADARRRVAQRAESVRTGLPPTRPPGPEGLEEQLGRVLAIMPPPGVVGPPAGGSVAPPAEPRAPAPPAIPPSLPPSAPAVHVPTPLAPPAVSSSAPEPSGPPPERSPVSPSVASAVPRPVATKRPTPPSAPATPITEPPPLPQAIPRLAPPVVASLPTRADPATLPLPARPAAEKTSGSGVPAPPPLPTVGTPIPEPAPPAPSAELPEPVTKRRRRTVSARKKSPGTEETAATDPGAEEPAPASAAKPKRRSVRKRKAPPVVGATPEPLPTPEPPPPSSSSSPPAEGS